MTNKLETLLRDVFSVDTEAGYRLRYHITRALVCEKYAKELLFESIPLRCALEDVFSWKCTSEGGQYWAVLAKLLHARIMEERIS